MSGTLGCSGRAGGVAAQIGASQPVLVEGLGEQYRREKYLLGLHVYNFEACQRSGSYCTLSTDAGREVHNPESKNGIGGIPRDSAILIALGRN